MKIELDFIIIHHYQVEYIFIIIGQYDLFNVINRIFFKLTGYQNSRLLATY